ncbi:MULTISPECIES: putative O-glycosylation ligase, exosortase A system-associated [Thioalkalivibrio]|uniref:putative O-glycosylation ligase, exosortase A system-associated n=1 Tax=Thioalkalivibrio TaxID=106633 RepID=UPI000375FC22|nr:MULTISPECIES: putative O-glycosylation ligase, exosortase A system-associated [Thioalkalivibrio]
MRDYLLFFIIMVLIPVILARPWVGIPAWFWVGLMAPHGLTWSFMRTFPVAAVIGITTLVALFLAKDRRPMPMTREMVMLWVFFGYITMTSYFAVNPSGAWDFWQHVFKILLITFITPMLIFGQLRIVWLLLVITFSIAFFGFKGGLFTLSTGGQYMVLGPPGSYLSGNTYIGLAMVMVLPLILISARLFRERWVDLEIPGMERFYRPISWAIYGVFWLTVIAILATYSRGALLGILVVAPFLFWHMRHKLAMVMAGVLVFGVIGVTAPDRLLDRWGTIETYEEDRSAMQRIQAWGVNWNMATERPLTGMGFRNHHLGYDWWIRYANFEGDWRHVLSPHSVYFGLIGEHGFGGLATFLLLVGFTFFSLNRVRKRARLETGQIWLAEYAWAIQVGLIGYLAAGAFLDVIYFNLLFAFIALAIIMRRELEEAPRVAEAPAPVPAQAPNLPAGAAHDSATGAPGILR